MNPLRVMIVDDSAVVRRLIREALSAAPDMVVSSTVGDGQAALEALAQGLPDLVTLDVEMPRMDGLTALKEIRRLYPRLPVIMFSTLTQRGGRFTIDALTSGANDYVTKPEQMRDLQEALETIRRELLPRIRQLCHRQPAVEARPVSAPVPPPRPRAGLVPRRIEGIAIGVSTGGPEALRSLLRALPANLPVPVVLVQHMPPLFTRILAERLDADCAITVREAADGERPPARMCLHRTGGQAPAAGAPGHGAAPGHQRGPAGEQLPPRRGCALPLRGPGLGRGHPGRGADRHGSRRARGLPQAGGDRGPDPGAGRGQQRGLGHARGRGQRGPGGRRVAPGPHRGPAGGDVRYRQGTGMKSRGSRWP
jgi:CheY-like chemotaxis protein